MHTKLIRKNEHNGHLPFLPYCRNLVLEVLIDTSVETTSAQVGDI